MLVNGIAHRFQNMDASYTVPDDWQNGNGEFARVVIDVLVGPLFDFAVKCHEDYLGPYCLPENTYIKRSTHMETSNPQNDRFERCFKVYTPTGRFNCSFGFDTGLLDDVEEVNEVRGKFWKTKVTESTVQWLVDAGRLFPEDSDLHSTTTDYGKIAYTLYVRMVKRMLQDAESSSFYARPSRLEIFEDSKLHGWSERFDTFNLEPRRKFEVNSPPFTQAIHISFIPWPDPYHTGQRAEAGTQL